MKTAHPLFIFAGEPSGDLHGSHLVKAIHALLPNVSIQGVAGPEMRAQGVETLIPMEEFTVMGFSDVLKSLPGLIQKFYQVRKHILQTQPKGVILIDYPGFNLRLAKSLRKKGYKGKIIQYISPTVWAHGSSRINLMQEVLDQLLVIYPFEKNYFTNTALDVRYVGHPLQDGLSAYPYQEYWTQSAGHLIAIFPGSRKGEIERNLPKQLAAAAEHKKKYPKAIFGLSCANPEAEQIILRALNKSPLTYQKEVFLIPKNRSYELMRDCRSAIAKSGTVTLELALHLKPTVVVYELTKLNRLIAHVILRLKLPSYCIVNILGNKRIFPELIEKGFTAGNLAVHLDEIDSEGAFRQGCIEECRRIRNLFSGKQASKNAAQAIVEILS